MSCCCVAKLTHMLQTSSFNQTHVPVASNSISLSCLEGRIYIITLLNPLPVLIILLNKLPVLVALRIPRGILLMTPSRTKYRQRMAEHYVLKGSPTFSIFRLLSVTCYVQQGRLLSAHARESKESFLFHHFRSCIA